LFDPGDVIDIWQVEARLGSGGMGSVYRCHNQRAKRILAAIKVLDGAFRKHPEAEARFVREAEILFGLDHPNIVKVRNIRTDGEVAFLEMEFVEGESLEDLLQEGPLPLGRGLQILGQMADALAYLHDLGIRHRDLKPANVLIRPDGTAKLVDFGLAVEADQTRITQANTTFGTVSYAPPEWIDPARLDPVKWDLYALGVVAFEILTGEVAFPVSEIGSARQQAMQVILAKQQADPLDPGPGAPEPLRALIRALTEVDPERRPDQAAAVRDAIRAIAADLPDAIAALPATGSRERPAATWSLPAGAPASDLGGGQSAAIDPSAAAPKTSAPRRRAAMIVLGLGALAAIALGSAAVVALAVTVPALLGPTEPPDRALHLSFTAPGLDASTTAAIRVDDALHTGVLGEPVVLPPGPPGEVVLSWVVGDGCDLAACACPEPPCTPACTCAHGRTTLRRAQGAGPQEATLAVPPPTGGLALRLTEGGAPQATWRIGEEQQTGPSATWDAMPPGPATVRVTAGDCGDAPPDCAADQSCPPGCSARQVAVVVPWTGRAEVNVELPVPARPQAAAAVPQAPAARPTQRAAARGGLVTTAAFAAWLAENPAYHPDAARVSGVADTFYLAGWQGAQPPAGAGSRPVVSVSYAVARAYCQRRGGLLAVDAAPLTWDEATGVGLEWRSDGGRPAWRQSDGATSRAGTVDPKSSTAFTGFRCGG